MRSRHGELAIALVVGTLVGVGAAAFVSSRVEAARPPEIPGFLWPDPKVLQGFALIDHQGEPFDLDRLTSRWSFLFFGYTHCPDVCPTTLSKLANVAHELRADGVAGGEVQFVFVSVDPARDTPARLGEYVAFFDPDFLGVTGPEHALEGLTRQLGIFVSRDTPPPPPDPEGRLVGVYQAPHDPAEIAGNFRRIRRFLEA